MTRTALSTYATGIHNRVPPTSSTTTTTLPCLTARCILDRALHGPECAGGTVPAKITKKLDAAVHLIEQANSAPAKKAKRLVKRAKSTLKVAEKAARKAAKGKKPKLSSGCAAAIGAAVDGVRGGL
jgi:hypothetical protein